MSFHIAYPSQIVRLLFEICFSIPSYVHQQLLHLTVKSLDITTFQCFLPILGPLLVQGFIQERGPTIFKLFKNTICKGVCTEKWTEKRFIPFTPPPSIFFLNLSTIKNLKEALNMSTGMYCNIHLLEIMHRSSFKSPLSYPSSQILTIRPFLLQHFQTTFSKCTLLCAQMIIVYLLISQPLYI